MSTRAISSSSPLTLSRLLSPRALLLGSCLGGAALVAAGCGGDAPPAEEDAGALDAAATADTGTPPREDAGEATLDAGPPAVDAPTTDAAILRPDAVVFLDAWTAEIRPSYTWAVSLIAAEPVVDGHTPGVDVDGVVSLGGSTAHCRDKVADLTSSITFEPGVDNQLSARLLTMLESFDIDINANIANAIQEGTLLLLITIEGIDDFVEDDEITVRLSLGATEGGGAPTRDGAGRIAPGQRFFETRTLGETTGAIHQNRFGIRVASIPIPLILGGTDTTDLNDVQITARISEATLFDGEGGGGLSVDDLVAFAAANAPTYEPVIRTVLTGAADLDPREGATRTCDSISAGFRLEAVTATLVEAP